MTNINTASVFAFASGLGVAIHWLLIDPDKGSIWLLLLMFLGLLINLTSTEKEETK